MTYRNILFLGIFLSFHPSSSIADVKNRTGDFVRLSAIACKKNVLDAARASLTPTLHPKCLQAALKQLNAPKQKRTPEYAKLVNKAYVDAENLLKAMILYRLNDNHLSKELIEKNNLPANYESVSIQEMQKIIEDVFLSKKSLTGALFEWHMNSNDYISRINSSNSQESEAVN
jgi:hypothetical protein